ncbi:VanZ family protein [Lewinella cohaerens]|uniref:VanZ family protein n=1 Tax=Lewinella cohaerens TaxID=70995 RepID=UPI00037FABED|nr:VanZ family protein [Lewinella cohaerens]
MHLARRSSLIYIVFTLVWTVVIFYLSTMPGPQLPRIDWLMTPDKFGHVAVYGILAMGIFFSIKSYYTSSKTVYRWSFLLASGYGVAMELIQFSFFPDRYFELWDIVANIIGAFIALWLLKIIYH